MDGSRRRRGYEVEIRTRPSRLRYAPGDASWHHGWCLHSASENALAEDRLAFAVSFFAEGARIIEEAGLEYVNDEDHPSYDEWLPDLMPGDVADHDLLPIVGDDGGDA